MKYYRNGKSIRESSRSNKEADAKKLLRKRLGEISVGRYIGPDAEKVTIRELADDYLNDYRVNGKKSLEKAEQMIKRREDDKEKDAPLMGSGIVGRMT